MSLVLSSRVAAAGQRRPDLPRQSDRPPTDRPAAAPPNYSRSFRATVALIEPDDERTLTFEGQEARTILALVEAGPRGVTSLEISSWALRLAHYAMKLRRAGLVIDMVREKHDGPVRGHHGRYFLRSRVRLIDGGTER